MKLTAALSFTVLSTLPDLNTPTGKSNMLDSYHHSVESESLLNFLQKFKKRLSAIPPSLDLKITDQEWVKNSDVQVPIIQHPFETRGRFQFNPPEKVVVVGSFIYDTLLKSKKIIDVLVFMPSICLSPKDNSNHRYFRKRALYLTWIASYLNGECCDIIESSHFSYDYHPMRPVLLVKPIVNGGSFMVRILIGAPQFHELERFLPDRNNVRPSWFLGVETTVESYEPTPFYNSMILHDILIKDIHKSIKMFASETNVRDCIILIKLWSWNKGFRQFVSFPLTMFLVYCLKKNLVKPRMSPVQLFRKILVLFSKLILRHSLQK